MKNHQINTLEIALRESLKLQSHYAKLLNQYDGGRRMSFPNVDQWIERLREISELPPIKPEKGER